MHLSVESTRRIRVPTYHTNHYRRGGKRRGSIQYIMAKKSAISGEYIITIEDSDAVRVCQIFDNVIGSLREAAKSVKFAYDSNWNTQQFGQKLVKEFGDGETANVGEYTIVRRSSGAIESYRVHGNTIAVLRKIAAEAGLSVKPHWNTRTLGSRLVDFIDGDYDPSQDDEVVEDGIVARPDMTTLQLQKSFEDMFGGHLRIKQGVKRCDRNMNGDGIDITLGELGLKNDFAFNGEMTVGDFIAKAKEAGLTLLPATNDDWVTVLDGFTLDFIGQIPNSTTKEKMQAILDR